MKVEFQNLKGTKDFLPDEQIVRDNIIKILKSNFEKYGYFPMETPILNNFDLLAYKYDENAEILNEIYKFKDQGKRDLGLRFDLTVPFCKVISLNQDLTMPFRRYEIGKVFRDGPVKTGRAREFYQCDIDVVGIDGRLIEAEQMLMVKSIFTQLDIPVVIKWNNRKLMTGLLKYAKIPENLIDKTISLIDRLEKITHIELINEFNQIGIDEQTVNIILKLFNNSLEDYCKMFNSTDINILKEGIEECVNLNEIINNIGIGEFCEFSPKLARGLNIYTGTVFEFFDKEKRISSSLGGGGRYNRIITDFMDNGQNYPAVGLCFGLEPIYAILAKNKQKSFVDAFIIPMGTEIECLKLANIFRENNIKTIIEMSNKKVKKSFEYANKCGIKYVVVVGSNEVDSGLFALKNMYSGEQLNVNLDQMLKIIKEN